MVVFTWVFIYFEILNKKNTFLAKTVNLWVILNSLFKKNVITVLELIVSENNYFLHA